MKLQCDSDRAFLVQFQVEVPFSFPRGQNGRSNFAGEYLLTYLDEDTLVGQQTGGGGYFIFEKEVEQIRSTATVDEMTSIQF